MPPRLDLPLSYAKQRNEMASRTSRRRMVRQDKQEKPESAWSIARFLLSVAILTWALRSFLIQPFYIPSGSMLPTLYIGDYLAVAKWPYGYSRYSFPLGFPTFNGRLLGQLPKRGDVVVFRVPAEQADLIKRVIGLPGDTVEMRGGRLILNGQPVARKPLRPAAVRVSTNSPCRVVAPATPTIIGLGNRQDCMFKAYLETLPQGSSYTVLDQVEHGPADDFGPVQVPAGHLFLMGDNRDDSLDSRFPEYEQGIGMVPVENLIGRALITFWSTDGSASYVKPWTWFTALRVDRVGNGYTGDAR
jgi:signal peptidase I